MHNKAKAISAELLELDLKVQLYNPVIFRTNLVIIKTNSKIQKIQKEPKSSGKVAEK